MNTELFKYLSKTTTDIAKRAQIDFEYERLFIIEMLFSHKDFDMYHKLLVHVIAELTTEFASALVPTLKDARELISFNETITMLQESLNRVFNYLESKRDK